MITDRSEINAGMRAIATLTRKHKNLPVEPYVRGVVWGTDEEADTELDEIFETLREAGYDPADTRDDDQRRVSALVEGVEYVAYHYYWAAIDRAIETASAPYPVISPEALDEAAQDEPEEGEESGRRPGLLRRMTGGVLTVVALAQLWWALGSHPGRHAHREGA